jgi:hypothetical protein
MITELNNGLLARNNMNRNQKIFRWVFVIFTVCVAAMVVQMAMNTTAPWNKKKSVERAWGGDTLKGK